MGDRGAKVETYQRKVTRDDKRKQHSWRVKASNGRKLAGAGEGYNNQKDMVEAMTLVRDALSNYLEMIHEFD